MIEDEWSTKEKFDVMQSFAMKLIFTRQLNSAENFLSNEVLQAYIQAMFKFKSKINLDKGSKMLTSIGCCFELKNSKIC